MRKVGQHVNSAQRQKVFDGELSCSVFFFLPVGTRAPLVTSGVVLAPPLLSHHPVRPISLSSVTCYCQRSSQRALSLSLFTSQQLDEVYTLHLNASLCTDTLFHLLHASSLWFASSAAHLTVHLDVGM